MFLIVKKREKAFFINSLSFERKEKEEAKEYDHSMADKSLLKERAEFF
ncbi:MAG: hypothetical protein AAF202_09130 [Pseudomonadota bacterium]